MKITCTICGSRDVRTTAKASGHVEGIFKRKVHLQLEVYLVCPCCGFKKLILKEAKST